MGFIRYAMNGNYKRYIKKLKVISKNNHKSTIGLFIDTSYSVVRYGIGLSDYLNYKFYNRNHKERKEYAGIKIQDKFYEKVSPSAFKKRYTVKPTFLKEFKDYTKRDFVYPKNDDIKALKKFLNNNVEFMEKPADGLGGSGVIKVKSNDVVLKDYYEYLLKENCFVEGLVVQHDDLAKLCKESTNTMRIMTYNDHETPLILWAGLRVGNGINAVDNFHAGGMGIAIDLETGKLVGKGIDKDLNEYDKHPKTKVKFDGFQIPYFKEVKEMVKNAALESDKIRLVGWDVAVTNNGPVIIEGNRRPGFDIVQVISNRGRMDIIRDVLRREK